MYPQNSELKIFSQLAFFQFLSLFFASRNLRTHWYSVQIVVTPVVPGENVLNNTAAESKSNILTMNGVPPQY